jgi:hypothetical protein
MLDGSSNGNGHSGPRRQPRRCEHTGLTIPECSYPHCWARMQAREDVRRVISPRRDAVHHVVDAGIE